MRPVSPLPTVGLGASVHLARNMASDGDFVVEIDGGYLVARQGQHTIWKSKIGGLWVRGTMVMGQQHVYHYDGKNILSLDRQTGQQVWRHVFDPGMPYNPPQFVEVNGYLLAMFISLANYPGYGSGTYQNFVWWDTESGRKQETHFLIWGGETASNVCYAVAPTLPEAAKQQHELQSVFARVMFAYQNELYEVLLFDQKIELGFLPPWGSSKRYKPIGGTFHKGWKYEMLPFGEQILYLHMFDDYTCLVFLKAKRRFKGQ